MGDPKAAISGIHGDASIITPAGAIVMTGAGLKERWGLKCRSSRRLNGVINGRVDRRGGFAKNQANITLGIAADRGLVGPYPRATVNMAGFPQVGGAGREAARIDFVKINHRACRT